LERGWPPGSEHDSLAERFHRIERLGRDFLSLRDPPQQAGMGHPPPAKKARLKRQKIAIDCAV